MRGVGASLDANRREWSHLATADPMWAISSVPDGQGAWSVDEFFRSGQGTVASIFAGLEAHGPMPRLGRALDFGCGLGRLSWALAERFGEVVGVDISPEMIDRARRPNLSVGACRFVVNDRADLRGLASDSFDFVLSLVTLQHVSDRRVIRSYIREFVRVAAPGGVVVFQLPTSVAWRVRLRPRYVLSRALWRLPCPPPALMRSLAAGSVTLNSIPEWEVRQLLAESGAEVAAAWADNAVGTDAVPSITYVART